VLARSYYEKALNNSDTPCKPLYKPEKKLKCADDILASISNII
jgi:hypothetical protein